MDYFKYITPFIYFLLIITWTYILYFYLRKIVLNNLKDRLLKTLLIILAIDALRTLIESSFFGVWYTSLAGLIPIRIYNFLAQPEIVFFPKIINLIVSLLILFILIKKWIPAETNRIEYISREVDTKTKELLETQNKYIARFQFFPFPVFIWQKKGDDFQMISANRAAHEDSDGNIESVFGIDSKILWKDEPDLTGYLERSFLEKETFTIQREYTFRGSKKNKFVSATYSFLPPDSVQIVTVDITESKNSQKELIEQKMLFETMFNTLSDGVVITDTNRKMVLANQGMMQTFGYQPEELVGKLTTILYADEDRFRETGDRVYNESATGSEKLFITYYKAKDQTVFPGETFGTKLFDQDGNWMGNLGIIRNISERHRFIEDIKRAKERAEESDRLKSAFLANMSHEVRTPMNGILGFTELLKEPRLTGEQQQQYISIIEKSGDRMLNIINDIISISKLEAGQMETNLSTVNINEQLEFILSFFRPEAEAKGIKLIGSPDPSQAEFYIETDKEKLIAILTNLVKNALKFTSQGSIETGFEYSNKEVKFFVRDTGLGIPDHQKELIFERFRQGNDTLTKSFEGTGLGLSISKAYVELMGGKIGVESMEGTGSTFWFTIPV